MVILLHIGGEQISMFFQGFLVLNDSKRWQFCNLINARANVHISRVTKSFLSSRHIILGHPVQQFLQKPEFSDFTVSGSGLPKAHRYWKDVSLGWSNLYFMANAPGGHGPYYFKYKSLLKVSLFTLFNNMWKQKLVLIENIKSVSVPTF